MLFFKKNFNKIRNNNNNNNNNNNLWHQKELKENKR